VVHRSSVHLSKKDIGKFGQMEKIIIYDEEAAALQGAHAAVGEQHDDTIWQKSLRCAYLPPTYHQFLQFHRYTCGFQEHVIIPTVTSPNDHHFLRVARQNRTANDIVSTKQVGY